MQAFPTYGRALLSFGSIHFGSYPDPSYIFMLSKQIPQVVQVTTLFPEIMKNVTQSADRVFLAVMTSPDMGTKPRMGTSHQRGECMFHA